MKLYSIQNNKLVNTPVVAFKRELPIQKMVEANLKELFNLEFVKSEFAVRNFRIDTLAYNRENKSFVIIEYKKERNSSVIDQGYTYLSLMLNNKADFVLEYNENNADNIKREDVDWSQSRIIFISPNFTDFQKNSINFKDVPFELWEITQYENGLFGFTEHKVTSDVSISTIKTGTVQTLVNTVTNEIRVYDEEYFFKKSTEPIIELYKDLKQRILELGADMAVSPKKSYISFKRKTNVVDIDFQKNTLWMWLNVRKGELDDPKKLARDVSGIGHYGNGDYDLKVDITTDLNYVMFLINQSYKKQD